MVMNRRKKENTGNGVSSFADLEDQHRQEAQRQVQSVSRGNREQADQTMGNIIEQQNQEARQQVQQTNNVYKDADKYIDATAEYAKEGFADLPENLTRSVDKRGSGKVGDDLLSEIASGHSLEALEQAQRAEQSGDLAINAGKQYTRGLISAGTGIYDAAEGYTRVEEALMSPEAQYQAYVLANQGINPANTEGYGTVEEGNKYFNDLIQGYQNSELRAGLNEAYNSLENELSDTMVGQALESAGRQTPRGLLTAALGTAGAGVLSKPALDALQKTASLGIMGAEVAGQDMYRTLTDEEHDYTAQQALAHGLASAGGEILTENLDKIPIIKDIPILVNSSVTGQAMGLKDLIGEGYEEYVNQRLDPFINMTLQDNSNGQLAGNAWNALKEAYSPENTAQAFKAGAEGALSAAFTSGITNPTQTISQWQEDIQNLQNLPSDITRAATQTMNQIRGTNEYEKALKQNLVYDQEAQIDMMPEGAEKESAKQTLKETKENLWNQFGTKENLRSDDILVREAAEAANKDRILTQAREAGMSEDNAQRGAELANLIKETLQVKDRNTFVTEYGENNGVFDPVTGDIVISSGTTDPFMVVIAHEAGGHAKEGSVEFRAFIDSVAEAIDSGKIKAVINGNEFRNTQAIENSIGRQYLDLFLDDQRKAEYASFFDNEGHVSDVRGLNDFLAREDIQQIVNSEAFQDMLDSERSAYLTQVALGSQQAVDYLKGRKARPFVDTLSSMMAALTNNEQKLRELDSKKTLHKALDLYKDALNEDITYERSNAGINRMARDLTNNAVQNRQFSRDLDSEGKELTQAQQAYFKDSKIRDENGNLLVVYHGTEDEFNVFKRGKSGYLGGAIYLTTDKSYANKYANKYYGNGKVMELYANVTNPLIVNTQNPTKEILNAIYGSDRVYNNRSAKQSMDTMIITKADLNKLQSKGYDGIVWDYAGSKEIAVFDSNQVKNITNENPTSNKDIRHSRDLDSEYREDGTRKDLRAVHNLNENKLRKTVELGGMVMPSIAVTKDSVDHSGYGDISVVFDKASIDPSDSRNRIYKRDAWTPTFPQPEVEVDSNKVYELNRKIDKLTNGRKDMFGYIGLDSSNVADRLDRYDGDPVEAYKNVPGLKLAYAAEQGIDVPIQMQDADLGSGFVTNDKIIDIYKIVGKDFVKKYIEENGYQMFRDHPEVVDKVKNYLIQQYDDSKSVDGKKRTAPNGMSYGEIVFGKLNEKFSTFDNLMHGVYRYAENETIPQVVDTETTKKTLDVLVDQQKYERWLSKTFKGIIKSRGIRKQNVDPFTRSGTRKSFKQTHDPYTAQGVLDNMLKQHESGSGGWGSGFGGVLATYQGRYGSLDDVVSDENRLTTFGEAEKEAYDDLNNQWNNLRTEVADSYEYGDRFDAMSGFQEAAAEFARKNHTVANAKRIFKEYALTLTDAQAQQMIDILEAGRNLRTDYFEAKPRRVLYPNEWKQVYAPNTTDPELLQQLRDMGVETYEYDPSIPGDRQAKMNENAKRYQFSRQLDADYLNAVENGDTQSAERYVEQAAKEWGAYSDENGVPIKMYHGTHSFGFTQFKSNWVFLTDDVPTASTYASGDNRRTIADRRLENIDLRTPEGILKALDKYGDPEETFTYDSDRKKFIRNDGYEFDIWPIRNYAEERVDTKQDRGIYSLYARMQNPLVIDGNGAFWKNIPAPKELLSDVQSYMSGMLAGGDAFSTEQYAMYAEDRGYDGVVFNNISDNGMSNMNAGKVVGNVYVAFGQQNVKSADTETYDDKGNLIPLSERFSNSNDIRYSRDLLDDNNLAKVNPIMIQKGGGIVDYRLSASERQIDRSKIPASVLDKAYTYTDFAKKFEKKNKMYSDMTWLGQQLRHAQEEVNRENAEYRGKEAFGGGYGEVVRRLKEAGVKDPREVIDQYLDRITWKGTQEADAAIENDPNASVIMNAIKTNLNPKFIEDLQNAHFASQRKAQKTRDESRVKGTEAYYRKSLEKGRSYVKERTSELLKGLGADIDMRMSPMKAQEYFGGNGVVHSPIGDARAALRESGITKTSEYSDWLKLYFLESLEGYKHNDEMLSRLKDKILSDEQLASDSDMANGGFEYMLEQLDNAAKRYLRLKTEMEDPDYNNDRYMSDLYQVGTVVPLTENDHMSTATRDLRLAGALGTTSNDPRLAQVAEKVESIIREMSADESITGMSYTNFDPTDRFARNNPYMKRIYDETGIRDEWIIDQIYHDMKLAHGRNNQRPYIPAPTQSEINLATAKRRAESAAKTREFFNNRDSLNEAVEEASANEAPEETIPVEDIPVNEEQVNTSAYGAENYMFPGDLDDPRRFQQFDFDSDDINPNNNTGLNEPFSYEDMYARAFYGDDYQTQPDDYQLPTDADAPEFEERIVPTDEYTPEFADQRTETEFKEATEGVDKGNYVKLEDYMPGKLFSEMTEEDIRKTKQEALKKKEYIDTLAAFGMNKGSTGMTLEQNRNQIADGNEDVDEALQELFEKPLADAKDRMFEHWAKMAEKLDYVVNKLGIKERSKESKGMQWYMERTQDTRYAPRGSYTLENLKRDFPDKWKDIKKGAEILEEMYDEYYTKINESLEMNYPEKVLIEEEKKLRDMLDDQIAEKQALLEKLLQDPRRNAGQIQKLRGQLAKIAKRYNDITHEVRVNKRLPLRADYAHHYLDTKMTLSNFIQAFKDVYNNRAHNNISNKLAPISQDTKPLTRWWGAMQRRKRGDYTRDAIGGMLRYWDRAEQKIFIDPYSGYLRGVVSELARSADEAETDQSSMIRYYSAYINSLTGKTNPYDRALTYAFNGRGRQVVSLLKTLNGRIKSNAVMGNFNSMIAQVYNLPNAVAILNEHGGAKSAQDWKAGLGRFMQDKFAPDKECDASTFLTERYWNNVIDPLRDISTPAKFASSMMEFGDRLVAEMTWYAAKAQGERLGVGNTVRYADEMTRRAVAGRGIGEVPISQQSEITKLFAPFQVEVNNAYQLMKHLAGEKQAGALLSMFLTAFFMNLIKKKVTKTDGTGFDPIGAIVDAFKEKGQWRDLLDSEEWDDIAKDAVGNLLGDFISNMPYGSLIAEFAGLSSNGYGNSYFGERDPTRYGIGNIGIAGLTEPLMTALFDSPENVDWTKLITNYGLPYGGKQAERTIKTMQDLGWIPHFGQGNYSWKEGAYTKNGDLKYVIDTDNPLDVARALMFGTYASEAGQEYLENRRTLGGNGVTVFNTLVDAGVDSSDAYQVMRSLGDVEYPAGTHNAKSLATRKALEDAGVWDEWSEAYNSIENKKDQDNFLYGTNSMGSTVAGMDEDEFQRAYDAVFGTGEDEAVNVPAEAESVPAVTESASMSPSRQQAYDTVTSADIGIDSDSLSQTMSSLATQNLTDADGNKIDNSRSAVNRLSYEEDGSYQAIIDFIESDDNKNSDDPLTYADFGLSKSVVNMDDEELEELLEQINEGTGSTYRRRSGGSSRGNSRRANVFRRSGTSAIRSLGNQHISTYVPKKKGSYTRSTDTIRRLQNKTKSLSNGVMQSDVDLYDSIFNK